MSVTAQSDTSDASYDPAEEKYWQRESLDRELSRNFEICNGCRLCFKYCPSFPELFQVIDNNPTDAVNLITPEQKKKIIGYCFQCKLCYIKCPYTDQDKHSFDLNFPALMQRAVHIQAANEGINIREKILQNPDLAGKLNTGFQSRLINKILNIKFFRRVIEFILGIHKDKNLPEFHKSTFQKQIATKRAVLPVGEQNERMEKVILFATCFVNYNQPKLGIDVASVLEKNKISFEVVAKNCCGMPALNSGDMKFALKKMKRNVEELHPYVEKGYKILVINPTCSLTIKNEYPLFLPPGKWREKGKAISGVTYDLFEYLFSLKKDDKLNRKFKSTPESIAYHVPCHLRAQNIGYRSRDIMKLIPDTMVHLVTECCGHNGTWAMKKEYFPMSLKVGKNAFDSINQKNSNFIVSDCPMAAIQIKQGLGYNKSVLHPAQIIARAYLDPDHGGFQRKISADDK